MEFLKGTIVKYRGDVLAFARKYYNENRFIAVALGLFTVTTPSMDNTPFLSLIAMSSLVMFLYPELTGEDRHRSLIPRWIVVLVSAIIFACAGYELLTSFNDMGIMIWIYTLMALIFSGFLFACLFSIGHEKIESKTSKF